ncbi:MAG TPA: polysaccharide biosynthesis tyrosine autokinase [Pyrinomonadaceae bacterium]|nr:polysaccharide biosynthesis tyrosine autokinase [Pyrinomonadaceae bacterium]
MKESREIIQKPVNEPVELERHFEPQIVPGSGRYPAYRDNYASEGFQLLDYWKAIRKRLWLVIGIVVLVTTLTAIYMARKPNIYAATARIQVDLEQTNPDLVTPDRQRPLSNQDPSYFNTQLQLLDSESLLRQVVKDHSLDTNKEFLLAVADGGGMLRGMLKTIGLASDSGKKEESAEDQSAASASSSLISSDEIAEAVRLAPYIDVIRKNMSAEPVRESRATVKDTRLIELSFRHTNPTLAAFVVNSIGETFVTQNQNKRTGTSRKTSDFLQKRITDLQSEIRSGELELVELKRSGGILQTDKDQTLALARLAGLNKDLLTAENQRKTAEAEFNALRGNPEAIRARVEIEIARYITERENNISAVRNDTQKRIAEIRSERARLLQEYKESAPEIVEKDTMIKSLEDSLTKVIEKNNEEVQQLRDRTSKFFIRDLETKHNQTLAQENKIRASYDQAYNEAQVQNSDAVKLKLLEQTIETNKGFLDNLRKQQSSNDVASQGSDNNISVAQFAIPPEHAVSPSRLTTVVAALFLSTLFGMGLALFLEYLDDTIRSTEEIETYLQLPALAAIPTIDSIPKRRLLLVGGSNNEEVEDPANSELLIYADSRSSLAEAYRQLRTSILLSTAGHAPKSLLITSSLPSEGKTTTATNTAISLAQTGAKVLIIDADLRRPRLHSVFNIDNGDGLSTILSAELTEAEILNIVKQDDGTKLYMLTSGPIPPNPAELIGSEQMANLLKLLQQHFTHVVVDSPPITSFTDGVLIASMVDGVILVVHAGKSSRQVVRRARQLLHDVGAKIFGVVLNNVNLRSQDNYYYYQSYYQRDSYPGDEQ